MKLMNASDCGSTGALVMSSFHQLSPGNICRPPKSSRSRALLDVEPLVAGDGTAAVDGVGDDGEGDAGDLLPHDAAANSAPAARRSGMRTQAPCARNAPSKPGKHTERYSPVHRSTTSPSESVV